MNVGERIRELRLSKKMSQGDIEKKTGLMRAYVSRVENIHIVPAVETLEKFANALDVPLYQLFYDGNKKPQKMLDLPKSKRSDMSWGSSGEDARALSKFRHHLAKADDKYIKLLMFMAQKMAAKNDSLKRSQ